MDRDGKQVTLGYATPAAQARGVDWVRLAFFVAVLPSLLTPFVGCSDGSTPLDLLTERLDYLPWPRLCALVGIPYFMVFPLLAWKLRRLFVRRPTRAEKWAGYGVAAVGSGALVALAAAIPCGVMQHMLLGFLLVITSAFALVGVLVGWVVVFLVARVTRIHGNTVEAAMLGVFVLGAIASVPIPNGNSNLDAIYLIWSMMAVFTTDAAVLLVRAFVQARRGGG